MTNVQRNIYLAFRHGEELYGSLALLSPCAHDDPPVAALTSHLSQLLIRTLVVNLKREALSNLDPFRGWRYQPEFWLPMVAWWPYGRGQVSI
jgi:hypothetical protein